MSLRAALSGSGSPAASLNRCHPAVMVEWGDSAMVVDAGDGVVAQLLALGSHSRLPRVCSSKLAGQRWSTRPALRQCTSKLVAGIYLIRLFGRSSLAMSSRVGSLGTHKISSRCGPTLSTIVSSAPQGRSINDVGSGPQERLSRTIARPLRRHSNRPRTSSLLLERKLG